MTREQQEAERAAAKLQRRVKAKRRRGERVSHELALRQKDAVTLALFMAGSALRAPHGGEVSTMRRGAP